MKNKKYFRAEDTLYKVPMGKFRVRNPQRETQRNILHCQSLDGGFPVRGTIWGILHEDVITQSYNWQTTRPNLRILYYLLALSLNLGIIWRWLASFMPRPLNPLRKNPGIQCIRGQLVLQQVWKLWEGEKSWHAKHLTTVFQPTA